MAQQISSDLAQADAVPKGLDGGLNLKADPTRLAPPATTRSDNALYAPIGSVAQLPAFASVGLSNARHVYNLHARDCNQPSSSGDLMVHGEYPDGTDGYTVSTWAHNNGANPSLNQPCLPFTARTKVLGGRLGGPNSNSGLLLEQTSLQFARQEIVPAGQKRRYAMGFGDNSVFRFVVGNVDGLTESAFISKLVGDPGKTVGPNYPCDLSSIQGTSNWCGITANNAGPGVFTLQVATFDFNGTLLSTVAIPSVVGLLDDGSVAYQIVQHAGRTLIAYFRVSDKFLYFYDVVSAVSYSSTIGSGSLLGPFTVFSPYTHTANASQFLGVLRNTAAYVLYRANSTSNFTLVMGPQALAGNPVPPAGAPRLQATATMLINDNQGGVGGNASFLITVFRNYPEVNEDGLNFAQVFYNSIGVNQLSYTAPANPATFGTVSNLQTNVFRAPGGLYLASYAFNMCPSEAGFVGSSQSKQALCLVRAMPLEPIVNGGATYGQPTYFLINHRARVAGRFLEGLTIGGSLKASIASLTVNLVPTANSVSMSGLARPLFLSGDDTTSDLAVLTIAIPAWSITAATATPTLAQAGGAALVSSAPYTANYTPTAIVLQQTAANSSVPAVQGGPYSIMSGPVTTIHDGASLVEANFNFACPNLVAVPRTGGNILGSGPATYYYVGVLEWYDEQGQLHRSAPSLPLAVYISGTIFYGTRIWCPAIPTSKSGNVIFKLYRSIANRLKDFNYYYVGYSILGLNVYSYTIDDNVLLDTLALTADNPYPIAGSIIAQPRLYTGVSATAPNPVYASTPPPPFIWQTGSKGRAFGLAQIQGQFQLFYSSPTAAQLAPEWNSFNYLPVPFDIGDVRSIEGIDDKIVIFGTRYNGVIAGDGPPTSNQVGVPNPGDGFGTIVPIPTPAGVIGTGSPTRTPDGIVFQGFSGIQLLDRSLTIQPVGLPVDPLTGRQIGNPGVLYAKGATLPSIQSVVWPNAAGPALVYSYLTKKFSTWPLYSNGAAMVQMTDGSIYAAIQPIAGNVYAGPANAGSAGADLGILGSSYSPLYIANPAAPALVLETPWILPHGSSGSECRVWNMCLTGTWNGPHTLRIEQAYNYEGYTLSRVYDMTIAPRQYQVIAQPQSNTRMVSVRYRISLLPLTNLSAQYAMATLSDLVLFSANQQGTVRASAANRG